MFVIVLFTRILGMYGEGDVNLRFWEEENSKAPGTGKTLSFRYSRIDPTFHDHWEILYDWS